jgi:copper(I)-binding protein
MRHLKLAFTLAIAIFIFHGCQSKSDSDSASSQESQTTDTSAHELESDDIELTAAWLRPGSEGGNSAAYLNIFNGTNSADTLLSIETEIAPEAEIHLTFEEDGMTGMRPAGEQVIAPDSNFKLEPGGLHLMVMGLNRSLAEGDSISLELEFTVAGKREITAPVTMSDSKM